MVWKALRLDGEIPDKGSPVSLSGGGSLDDERLASDQGRSELGGVGNDERHLRMRWNERWHCFISTNPK